VIGMRPAMASMSSDGNVQKIPVIQRAALYCIFFSSDMFLIREVPLKNHSWNSYRAIDKTHVLYKRHFWIGRSVKTLDLIVEYVFQLEAYI